MESRRYGDVELHGGAYWDIGLCAGAGGVGGVCGSVGVDGADDVGSGGRVGDGCGDSDSAGSIGGCRLCGSGI